MGLVSSMSSEEDYPGSTARSPRRSSLATAPIATDREFQLDLVAPEESYLNSAHFAEFYRRSKYIAKEIFVSFEVKCTFYMKLYILVSLFQIICFREWIYFNFRN